MTTAPGLLDQRVTFYARQEVGADGFARPVYVRTGEWWGRVDVTADTPTVPLSPQGHTEQRAATSCTVADYVPVPTNGVCKVSGSDALYWVRGVVDVRILRRKQVALEWVEPTAYAEFEVFEAADVVDGVHLLTIPEAE